MNNSELIEFVAMLLIEKKCNIEPDFYDYVIVNSDKDTFNKRYVELLDKFLNQYALK